MKKVEQNAKLREKALQKGKAQQKAGFPIPALGGPPVIDNKP
jgi:hypothetical protein